MDTVGKIAIIIVDMQKDFADDGALPVKGTYALIPVINKIVKDLQGRAIVITTQDWHPKDAKHFDKWPPHCIAGSKGAELVDGLELPAETIPFIKGWLDDEDGYSAFDGIDSTYQEWNLDQTLKHYGVTTVYIMGVATDYCVKATVLDAIKRGYNAYLIENAVSGVAEDTTAAARHDMAVAGVVFAKLH